jgi:formylglycine-generating enzyme required for sulfatase activity
MAKVGPEILRPLYPSDPKITKIKVPGFLLDRVPVTNGEFLRFIKQHARWRRDRISPLFADQRYLSHWEKADKLGKSAHPKQPVVFVSWFAAKAYCESRGARLPIETEWELAGQASFDAADGKNDLKWKQTILNWYAKPTSPTMAEVGTSKANYWGVRDLHGLIWEWILDFNSTMFSVDNRGEGDGDKATFCGSGSLKASDKQNYASFMRFAFRSSLEAKYTTSTLGFRCAKDLNGVKK